MTFLPGSFSSGVTKRHPRETVSLVLDKVREVLTFLQHVPMHACIRNNVLQALELTDNKSTVSWKSCQSQN